MSLSTLPLAFMDLRCPISSLVTVSDASEQGGGICASHDLSASTLGEVQSFLTLDKTSAPQKIFLISAFSGISPMHLALQLLKTHVVGSIIIEPLPEANRVSRTWFPGSQYYDRIEEIDLVEVQSWARKYSTCDVVIVCGGPPWGLGVRSCGAGR